MCVSSLWMILIYRSLFYPYRSQRKRMFFMDYPIHVSLLKMHFHQYVSFAYTRVKRNEKIFSYNQQDTNHWKVSFKILKKPDLNFSIFRRICGNCHVWRHKKHLKRNDEKWERKPLNARLIIDVFLWRHTWNFPAHILFWRFIEENNIWNPILPSSK